MKEAIVQWYRYPENEFLHREINWSFHYLFRTRGFLWIAAYILVKAGVYYLFVRYVNNMTMRAARPLQYVAFSIQFLLPLLVTAPLWASMIRRRIYAHFEPDRIHDIGTTTVKPPELWPALLVAPALVLTLVTQIGALFLTLWSWFPRLRTDYLSGYNLAADFGWIGVSISSGVLSAAITYLMYTAAAVYMSLPTRSIMRACVTVVVLGVIWTAINSGIQVVIVRLLPPDNRLIQEVSWIFFFIYLACYAMLTWWIVKRLRRRSYWDRLLRSEGE